MDILTLPILLSGLNTLKDGSIKFTLETRELSPEKAGQLLAYRNQEGWMSFSPNPIDAESIKLPDEKADSMSGETKTQAQRLRAVIWRIWEQNGKKGDSEAFYRTYMSRLIEREKENLSG